MTTHAITRMSGASDDITSGGSDKITVNPGKEAGSQERTMLKECKEALELWLQWDEQHRGLTELLFDGQHDAHHIEELLDICDVLRQRAVELSRRVLNSR